MHMAGTTVAGTPVITEPVVTTPARTEEQEHHETLPESLAGTAYVFVIGLFIMTFLFQNYMIPSASMTDTLLIGDHVVVDRTTIAPQKYSLGGLVHYRPVQRGDIIVFVKPNPESPDLVLVKRAIGLPGDRIHLEHGILYRNGQRLNEPQISLPDYAGEAPSAYESYRDNFPRGTPEQTTELWAVDLPNHIQNGELIVPPDTVFAMGDNRTGSLDSRFWGFVPRENILGRPMFVYWSFITPEDQNSKTGASNTVAWILHEATHFFSDTRWARTGHVVR